MEISNLNYEFSPNYILNESTYVEDDLVNAFHAILRRYTSHVIYPMDFLRSISDIQPIHPDQQHIQLLYYGDNFSGVGHWVCLFYNGDILRVYDSLLGKQLPPMQKAFVDALLPHKPSTLFVDVQRQRNNYDCGVMAIAFATSLAMNKNPVFENYVFDQMRPHLVNIIESGELIIFPSQPRKPRGNPRRNIFLISETTKKRSRESIQQPPEVTVEKKICSKIELRQLNTKQKQLSRSKNKIYVNEKERNKIQKRLERSVSSKRSNYLQLNNSRARKISRQDLDYCEAEQLRNTQAHQIARQDLDYREAEQLRNTHAHQIARQDLDYREAEQLCNTQAHQMARQDLDYREAEQLCNTEAHQIARQDLDYREAEQLCNTQARQIARQDLDYREAEQLRNTLAHQIARQDLDYHEVEQLRNTQAHHLARQDFDYREAEKSHNTEAHQVARQNLDFRDTERRRNTRLRRIARQRSENEQLCEPNTCNNKEDSLNYDTNSKQPYYTVFEKSQKFINWDECQICRESFPNLKVLKGACTRCNKTELFNLFTIDNNMDPGECPAELKDLTMIEEQLIAKVHPVISVYRIRGQQFAFSGQIINFPQDVNTIATQLPHSINSLSSILIIRRQGVENYKDFRVSRNKVYRALKYLKENNIYYKDIEISYANLAEIPENGNLTQVLSQEISNQIDNNVEDLVENTEEVIDTNILGIAPNDQLRMVRCALGTAGNPLQWPEISSNPINEFTTAGYIAMAFPTLFPTGAADLRSPRQKTVTHLQYFQHLMRYKDQRFAKHSRFRFFALNSHMRWSALQNSSVCVKRNSEISNLSVAELKHKMSLDPSLINKLICFNSNLRGTSTYWHARCNELLEMVEFLGTPTLFFTLSAADLHWPELYRIIAPQINFDTLKAKSAIKMKNKLLNENPLLVSWFFQQRADVFINKMMKPYFSVKDYWYRTEFQHRGSPHIHGILWLEDAPDVTSLNQMTENDRQGVANFFGNLVTTINPNINKPVPIIHPCQQHYSDIVDHQEDYENLINCCQRHTRHGKQCMRNNKKTKVQECRFKFPFPLRDCNELLKENDEWTFKSARNDPLINSHSRYVCEHWRANTDMQCIVSTTAILNYIAKYASKSEPKSKALEEIYSLVLENHNEGQAKEVLRKIFLKVCAERDISAQETFHILMGWPLYHASRSFVKINVENDQWIRWNMNETGGASSKCMLDDYPLRPQIYEGMSLKDFFSKHYKKGNRWITRRQPAVPRVFPRRTLNNNEEQFYRQQVILNVPWRSIIEFTITGKSWKELYNENIIRYPLLEIPEVTNEYEQEESDDDREQEEWMLIAGMGPNQKDIPTTGLGLREFDLQNNWADTYDNYVNPGNLTSFVSEVNKGQNSRLYVQCSLPDITLNNEQTDVVNFLKHQVQIVKRDQDIRYQDQCVIIQGKAGSGKSTLIAAMCHTLSTELGPNSFLLMAPTGVAAVNVGGSTIHSGLHIGLEKIFKDLDGEAAAKFQKEMETCFFVIIDEMSMVGCSMLFKIDQRCRQAKPRNSQVPFGGMCLYLLGDLKQLPPVMDRPFYGNGYSNAYSDQGQILYKSIKKCVILKTSHRQKGDDQNVFREVLDRLSVGECSIQDWKLLMTREKSRLSAAEILNFNKAVKLIPYNEAVCAFNLLKLKLLNTPIAKIIAKHNNPTAAKGETDVAQGLEKVIYLAKDSRVMLKSNLWVAKGLVNGALGYVQDIVYEPSSAPPHDMPLVVCVLFDKYTGPTINGVVPIAPMTRSWKSGKISCSRTQFPLSLAWAVTVHKSQGLTLDKVIVDIGDKELAVGCTYVALSRSKRLEDIIFDRPFDFVRLEKIKKMKILQSRITEETRLENIARSMIS